MRLTDKWHGGVPADHLGKRRAPTPRSFEHDWRLRALAMLQRVLRPTWSFPTWWLYRGQVARERRLGGQVERRGLLYDLRWAATVAGALCLGVVLTAATVPGWTSISNPAGAFGDTTQTPEGINQQTLAPPAAIASLVATPIYNVMESPFNAVGNGTADDSTACQAAVTAAKNSIFAGLGGTVYMPSGKYFWSVAVTSVEEGLTIIGDGQTGVSDEYATGSTQILTGSGVWGLTLGSSSSSEHRGYRLENLQFYENTTTTGLGGVQLLRVSDCTIRNVAVGRYLNAAGVGFLVDGTGDQAQYNAFWDCRFGRCATAGYQQKAANGTRHMACYFDGAENGSLSPLSGSTGCLITSGDTYRGIGTLYSGFDTLVDLGPNVGHKVVGGRFEFFTTQAVILRGGAGAFGSHIAACDIDNFSHGSVGTGVVISSGVLQCWIQASIRDVASLYTDAGTGSTVQIQNSSAVNFGPLAAGSLTYLSTFLTSAVTMTTAGTVYDGPSVALTTGTWLLSGTIQLDAGTTATRAFIAQLWDGTTIYANNESVVTGTGAAGLVPISFHNVEVVVSGSATLKISATSSVNGDTIAAQVSSGHTCSYINALKIG